MNKFAAVFAATALVGVTTAFAANPFSDVTPSSWAYQAVSQLAAQGIINGYPDGTFKGQNNITRYEVAQMVAKAMANQDRANAEQQAMINRLADEFSSELNNLGVRVANLEDRVGNIKATGDVRLRYQGNEKKDGEYKALGQHSKFDMRGRVQFNAKVNDNTSAVVRVTSGNLEFGDATNSGTAKIDRVYVQHKFGNNVTATAGRYNQTIGAGLLYDDTFDGAQVNIGNEKLNLQAAYGYTMEDLAHGKVFGKEYGAADTKDNTAITYVGLNGKVGTHTNVGGFWARLNGLDKDTNLTANTKLGKENVNVYGFNASANFNKIWVGGEWTKASSVKDSTAWVAGLGYGNYDQSKAGTWDVKAQYFNQDKFAPVANSTWNQAYDITNTTNGYKGWMATVDYALANNVGLSAYYGFDSKDQDSKKLGDFYRADLNYKF